MFENRNFIIPIDITLLNLFMILQLSNTEYLGNNNIDYWQYFAMRTVPFLIIFIQNFIVDGLVSFLTSKDQSIDFFLAMLVFYQLFHFIFYDFQRSTDSQLIDYFEDNFNDKIKNKNTKKVVVNKSSKRL